MHYRRAMSSSLNKPLRLRMVILLAVAFTVAACGESAETSAPSEVSPDSTTTTEQPTAVDGQADEGDVVIEEETQAVDAFSLGDREAGGGLGSLAVQAGEYAERLVDVEGDWFPGQPITLDIPDVCAIPEPVALQGITRSRPVDELGVRADVIAAEVRVYESAAVAESLVALVNGDSAEACDLATLESVVDGEIPGVSFDFGDGVGSAAASPDGVPADFPADSRNYDFAIIFGTVAEPLVQKATVVADGHFVIATSAVSTPEEVDDLASQVVAAVFAEPAPTLIEGPDLDTLVDMARRAVFAEGELPEFYEPIGQVFFGGAGDPDVCFTSAPPVARGSGPSWLAATPGAGASRAGQDFRIYADVESASAAFAELVERGEECFPAELELPDDFSLLEVVDEVVDVGGRQVLHVELAYEQLLGGQAFDVEAKIAITLADETMLTASFFGLAGDSPDLVGLLAAAADRGEAQ